MYPAARLAFCPNTYKPPSSNDEMTSKNSESCNGWMDLQRDLSIAAHDAGNLVVSNWSQKSIGRETDNRIFLWNISFVALDVRTSYSKMLHKHTRNGQTYQNHSTPLQLERVFYKE